MLNVLSRKPKQHKTGWCNGRIEGNITMVIKKNNRLEQEREKERERERDKKERQHNVGIGKETTKRKSQINETMSQLKTDIKIRLIIIMIKLE